MRNKIKLKPSDLSALKEALQFMKMEELKEVCFQLNLSHQGKKAERIHRILTFLEKGKLSKALTFPLISKAQKNENYPLAPETLILSGSYKNDSATRIFMKSLVGNHFHFTAFGQDWIRTRWEQGNPPTYAEFAVFWQTEHEARKQRKATPKEEWAYLNFVQKYCSQHRNFTRQQITSAWNAYRFEQVQKAKNILNLSNSSFNE